MKNNSSPSIKWSVLLSILCAFIITSCSLDNNNVESNSNYNSELLAENELGSKASPTFQYPTGFTVNLWLKSNPNPNHSLFTRYIRFKKSNSLYKDVELKFKRNSQNKLLFTGQVTAKGMQALKSMTKFGNRKYWDTMAFVNKGGESTLYIKKINVIIVYNKTQLIQIANVPNITLLGGRTHAANLYRPNSLNEYKGRMEYINKTMRASLSFNSLPSVVKAMIRDIGKSGSDVNYKYGKDPIGFMCSEAVSFYYKDANIRYGNDTFKDTKYVKKMADIFRRAKRFYGFHTGTRRFQKMDASNRWILPLKSNIYTPRPGDYLARLTKGNEHSMMVLKWNEASDIMWVLEGPHPVNIRRVDIYAMEKNEHDFAVGKVF